MRDMDDNYLNALKAREQIYSEFNENRWQLGSSFQNPALQNTYRLNPANWGVTIKNKNSSLSVNDESYSLALEKAVKWAINDGWKPKEHWWQFWLEEWPAGGVEEYKRQISVQLEQKDKRTIEEQEKEIDR